MRCWRWWCWCSRAEGRSRDLAASSTAVEFIVAAAAAVDSEVAVVVVVVVGAAMESCHRPRRHAVARRENGVGTGVHVVVVVTIMLMMMGLQHMRSGGGPWHTPSGNRNSTSGGAPDNVEGSRLPRDEGEQLDGSNNHRRCCACGEPGDVHDPHADGVGCSTAPAAVLRTAAAAAALGSLSVQNCLRKQSVSHRQEKGKKDREMSAAFTPGREYPWNLNREADVRDVCKGPLPRRSLWRLSVGSSPRWGVTGTWDDSETHLAIQKGRMPENPSLGENAFEYAGNPRKTQLSTLNSQLTAQQQLDRQQQQHWLCCESLFVLVFWVKPLC